jgi:hypothetical protein
MGNNKVRGGLGSLFTTKGQLRKPRGRPQLDLGIQFTVYGKLLQISKGRKISMWKAWDQLTRHRHFADLLYPHFKKSKNFKYKEFLEKIKDPDWQHDWYKNNVVKARLIEKLNEIDFTYIDNKNK